MTTPTPTQTTSGAPSMPRGMGGKATNPSPALAQTARVHKALNAQRQVRGPLVEQPANAARLATILHRAAQDLWDVATEQDAAQMWEEARAIASRILAACPTA